MADSKPLYAHADDVELGVSAAMDWDTGEITDESLAEHMDEVIKQGVDKVLAVALYQQGLLREAEMVKVEVDRLTKRQRLHERQAAKLKEYLARHAPRIVGKDTVKNHLVTVSWRKTPPRVEIDVEPWQLKPEHQHPPKIEADKAAIKADLKAGKEVEGCRLVQEERLSIK